MDFFDVAEKRYSYRGKFSSEDINRKDIEKILSCALKAPSGCNMQTTSFVVVTNKDVMGKISEIIPTEGTKTASFLIVVLTENIMTKCNVAFELEDYAAAVENALLAVTAMGLASVWLDGVLKYEDRALKIRELLDISPNYTVRAVLPVGFPTETVDRKVKKPFSERVTFID